jgi:hypothetical protein
LISQSPVSCGDVNLANFQNQSTNFLIYFSFTALRFRQTHRRFSRRDVESIKRAQLGNNFFEKKHHPAEEPHIYWLCGRFIFPGNTNYEPYSEHFRASSVYLP